MAEMIHRTRAARDASRLSRHHEPDLDPVSWKASDGTTIAGLTLAGSDATGSPKSISHNSSVEAIGHPQLVGLDLEFGRIRLPGLRHFGGEPVRLAVSSPPVGVTFHVLPAVVR